jgi:hypothetical protein
MIRASEDIIKMAYKMDSLKSFSGSIKISYAKHAFEDENFSLFPLYMIFSKYIGEDDSVMEYEPESVRNIVGNDTNGDRINTIISTTSRGDVWTNPIAFDMFTDASTGREINPLVLSPDYADEIAIGMINVAGIEGSIAMPFKTEVLRFIKACLDHDGWDFPPLPLVFKNIVDMYDDEEHHKLIVETFGHMSLDEIYNFSDIDAIRGAHPSLVNYFMRSQEVVGSILHSHNKMMLDWTAIVNG